MGKIDDVLKLLGRLSITSIFIVSTYWKLSNPAGTINKIQAVGIPLPGLAFAGAVALLVFGCVSLVLGWRMRMGTLTLIVFLVAATWFYHMDITSKAQLIQALNNLGLIGGLLFAMVAGPGKFSIGKQ